MIAQPSRRRRFVGLKIAVMAAVAAITVFSSAYRIWAYYGWIEYHLACTYSDAEIYEIVKPPTPELQDAIEEYENYFASIFFEKDRPFYREGDRFYM